MSTVLVSARDRYVDACYPDLPEFRSYVLYVALYVLNTYNATYINLFYVRSSMYLGIWQLGSNSYLLNPIWMHDSFSMNICMLKFMNAVRTM